MEYWRIAKEKLAVIYHASKNTNSLIGENKTHWWDQNWK
jgi:hypothetical protein